MNAARLSVREPARHELDGLDIARDDRLKASLDFHPEPDVEAPPLQERAAKRAACEPRARGLGEKASTLNHDLATLRNDRDDSVHVVSRTDRQLVKLAQPIDLQSIGPLQTRPGIERGARRTFDHVGQFNHRGKCRQTRVTASIGRIILARQGGGCSIRK